MNPCFVTTSFAPYPTNSGISNAAFLLIKYMYEKKGIRSTVFAPVQAWGKSNEENEVVSIKRFSASSLMNFGFSLSTGRLLQKEHAGNTYDLVHSVHYGFFPATSGYRFAKKNDVPHFFTTAYHPPGSSVTRSLMSVYNHSQGKHILAGSSAVFPFNENEKNQLFSYSKGNYRIIPCPVNDKVFYPKGVKFSRRTVTYIGTLLPWKGSQIALEIFKSILKERKDIDFQIIGIGPMESYLRENSGKVKILTNLSAEQVADKLSRSDLVVCPTKYESFGSAIAESLMCGTPVISTRVGAVPETVGPGGVLVDYGDWESMKKEIINLIDDDAKKRKLSQQAVKHASDYKYEKVSSKIYNTYKEFIA